MGCVLQAQCTARRSGLMRSATSRCFNDRSPISPSDQLPLTFRTRPCSTVSGTKHENNLLAKGVIRQFSSARGVPLAY